MLAHMSATPLLEHRQQVTAYGNDLFRVCGHCFCGRCITNSAGRPGDYGAAWRLINGVYFDSECNLADAHRGSNAGASHGTLFNWFFGFDTYWSSTRGAHLWSVNAPGWIRGWRVRCRPRRTAPLDFGSGYGERSPRSCPRLGLDCFRLLRETKRPFRNDVALNFCRSAPDRF